MEEYSMEDVEKELFNVTFVQNHVYTVEASSEDEAIDIAENLFRNDMLKPVAKTWYDEVEAETVAK